MVTQPLLLKEARDRADSPERIDELIQVLSPKRWLSLIALGTLVMAGGAWSVFGKIPITVAGKGVLVYPSNVVTAQTPASGRIATLKVEAGKLVKKGQILATLDQSELKQQLQQAKTKRETLAQQHQDAQVAQRLRVYSDLSAIAQQRQTLQQNLQTVRSLTPILREKGLDSIQQERQALTQRLSTLQAALPTYKDRWEARQAISPDVIPQDVVLQAKQEYERFQSQIDQAELELKQLDAKEARAQQEYLQNVNQMNELETQLKELDTRLSNQTEQDLSTAAVRERELQEVESTIAQLELQLQQTSHIVSDYDGTMLEVTAKPGQRLESGAGIGTISVNTNTRKLMGVVFLPVSDGKNVRSRMSVQVTPTNIKREEFGGIEGTIQSVSEFPITKQGAANLVGNPDVLPDVLSEGSNVAVFVDLQPNRSTKSGYRWSSSQGPDAKMTPGMTTSVRITVEERTPISYVLPMLKSWAGMS